MSPHNDSLVFALKKEAERVAQIHFAIERARTWREFRSTMPRADYSEIMRDYDSNGEPRPKGDDKFSGEDIPGWSDGDYPTWLQQEMDRILPEAVLRKYGTISQTFLNGSVWMLPESRLSEIVEDLEREGFVVRSAKSLKFW